MRNAVLGGMVAALILIGLTIGSRASDTDEAVVTVQVTSADHELEEGYFALGDTATIVAKPGSDLHRFLTRQRGKNIKITLTEHGSRELSRLNR